MKLFKKAKKQKKAPKEELKSTAKAKEVKKTVKDKNVEKEKPKPWSKKERTLLLAIFALLTGGSAALALSARSGKLPHLPRIKTPSLTLEKTYIFEGRNSEYTPQINALLDEYEDIINNYSGVYALYVYRLSTGVSYSYLADEPLQAASLIKLPTVVALLMEVEDHVYDLDSKPEGSTKTYRELIELMGKHSDNAAFIIVRNQIGDQRLQELYREMGLASTDVAENMTTARDMGNLLRKIWEEKLLSTQHSDLILNSLKDTDFEQWIVKGVDTEVVVAHKYGRETGVVNDAGIVFMKGNPYVIVIMGDGVVEREADRLLPVLSSLIYDFETRLE